MKGDKLLSKKLASSNTYGGRAVQESADMAGFRKMKGIHELDRAAEKRNRGAYRIMRTIGTKTFYFAGGVWQDSEYDAKKHTEIEKIKLASDRYMQLVKEKPDMVRFLSLGKMILLFDGKTYQITG